MGKLFTRLPSKLDVGKAFMLLFLGAVQGGLGILAAWVAVTQLCFNAHGYNKWANMWKAPCFWKGNNAFYTQLIYFPKSIKANGLIMNMAGKEIDRTDVCVSDSQVYGQALMYTTYLVCYVMCFTIVCAAITGSFKKPLLYTLLVWPFVGFACLTACSIPAITTLNNCMGGGLFFRWTTYSLMQGNLTTDNEYGRWTWYDTGYLHLRAPPCFWVPATLNYWFFACPMICAISAGIVMYAIDGKVKEAGKFSAPFAGMLVALALYGSLMPIKYIDQQTKDMERMMMRVFVHPLAMECVALPFRSVGKSLSSVSLRIAYLFFPIKTTTLYSRLLVNAVTDETLLIVSAILLGFVEIGMRTTVHYRDKLSNVMISKLTTRKFTNFDKTFLMEYKCSLVVLEMIFEMADIFTMAGFFSFLLQPYGALRSWWMGGTAADPQLRKMGFHVEDTIIKNGAIQAGIETAVGFACLTLEISLGFPVLQIVRKGYFMPFAVSSGFFSFWYTLAFFIYIFAFPITNIVQTVLDDGEGNHVPLHKSAATAHQYYDMYNTWIYYIPSGVEKALVKSWSEKFYG